ncbi:MAG TPA: glycosyltransferase family 4 protein [Steroidobacteraceae bacterium]|nr:glycosyltransferase family 4 protein [Steroidobacteraceae bacterium]
MSSRPLNVLSLGKDSSLFASKDGASTGDARLRHLYYAKRLAERAPGSQMRVVAYSSGPDAHWFERASEHLTLFGTRSRTRAGFLLDLRRRLRDVLADGWRPDVITSQEPWEEGWMAQSLARRVGARDVPQLHFDIMADAWVGESPINRVKRVLARRVITRASHVRVVSEPLKLLLADRWKVDPQRISVAPVGVNFKPSNLGRIEGRQKLDASLAGKRLVLFVGRLVAQKQLPLWLEVARRVHEQRPESHFVIVGDGELRASLESRARELGIAPAVSFLGSRQHAELPDIYAAADVFLLTSDYEGFGRVVLEAMLAARPVVSTICSGPEDLVVNGQSGFLAARGDTDALTDHVTRLVADPALAAAMGAEGARIADARFGLAALTDRIIDVWLRA